MSDPVLRQAANRIECSLPASPESIELFIAGVHEFLAEQGLGGLAFDMELLAREALVNAVHHGCGADSSKTVFASLERTDGVLRLLVQDQGQGFDWRGKTAEAPSPDAETGRGLFIIRKYSDTFSYNDPGNALSMTKRVPLEEQHMSQSIDGVARMEMEPRVSAQDVPALREAFRTSIQAGTRRLQLDFTRVQSLDSMGIGLLVATHNSLAKLGGALEVLNVNKDIHQLLCLMRLDKHFAVAPAPQRPA